MLSYCIERCRIPYHLCIALKHAYATSDGNELANIGKYEIDHQRINLNRWFIRDVRKIISITERYRGTIDIKPNEELHIYCLACKNKNYVVIGLSKSEEYVFDSPMCILVEGERMIAKSNTAYYVATDTINSDIGSCKLLIIIFS